MDKKYIIILFSAIFLAVISAVLSIYLLTQSPKTGFVEINKLYSAFNYKKELEAEYKNLEARRKNILDSLRLNYNVYLKQNQQRNTLNNKDFSKQLQLMQEQYSLKEEQFKQDNAALAEKYTQQILNQLNQYVQEYGRAHHYNYVFGANSNGTLMYAKDAENITEEVIQFVNRKYEGKN